MFAADLVDDYLAELPGDSRRLAPAEWGLTVPADAAGGRPLHVGLRLVDGLLTAKAPVLDAEAAVDPWMLLWWNRQTRMVRFGCTQAGEIWVHADLPAPAVDERGSTACWAWYARAPWPRAITSARGTARRPPACRPGSSHEVDFGPHSGAQSQPRPLRTGPSMRAWVAAMPKRR